MSLNLLFLVLLPLALTAAAPFLSTLLKMLQVVFRVTDVSPAQLADCPQQWQQPIQTALQVAQGLGFEVIGYDWYSPSQTMEPPRWGVVLQMPEGDMYLTLVVNTAPAAQPALLCNFYTYFTDGTSLTTTNEPQPWKVKPNPKRMLSYLEGDNIEALHARHCQALAQLKDKKKPLFLQPEKFAQTWKRNYLDDLAYLAQIQAIHWVQPRKTYRLAFLTAAHLAWDLSSALWQGKLQKQTPKTNPTPTPTVKLTPDDPKQDGMLKQQVTDFFAAKQLQDQGKSLLIRLTIFFVSFGAFWLVYASQLPGRFWVFLVGVMLLHEFGHIAAMWLFGYKNISMLFIPFLGAFTTARKDNASLTERFWIALAGPIPGILLGIFLAVQGMQGQQQWFAWFRQSNWQMEASAILLGFNLLNLLPIYPLDGGQIVNLLLFSKNAYLAVGFQGLGVLCLFLIGLYQPLFLVFALLMAIPLPKTWQIARTRSRLHRQLRHINVSHQESFIRTVFQEFQQPPYQHWPIYKQQMIAQGLLESHREHNAPWFSRLGLAGIYLLALLFSLSILIAATISVIAQHQLKQIANRDEIAPFFRELQERQARRLVRSMQDERDSQWQALNQELARNPQNADAYLRRAKIYYRYSNYQAALADVNYAIHLNSQSAEGYMLRSRIYIELQDYERANEDERKATELYWQQR